VSCVTLLGYRIQDGLDCLGPILIVPHFYRKSLGLTKP
jgi:hypothetical protein